MEDEGKHEKREEDELEADPVQDRLLEHGEEDEYDREADAESTAVNTKDLVTSPTVWPRAEKNSNACGRPS